jgi:hypothetical protein
MKQSFLLYLFILSLVFTIFTYAYYSKQVQFQSDQIEKLTKKMKSNELEFNVKLQEVNYFSLDNNDKAKDYFYSPNPDQNFEVNLLIPSLKDKLLEFNDNPNGNPLTGQEKLGVNKFIINKVKVLNHRWIIADYSDGEYWGEVLLKYFVNEDKTFTFEVNQSILYPKE